MSEPTIVQCYTCQRDYDVDSESIVQIGEATYRCKSCDDLRYPNDYGWVDEDYDDPFDLDAHPIQCAVCGGEYAESWSTCDCEDGPTEY